MNEINGKLKDVKFVENLKSKGLNDEFINELHDSDMLRTRMSSYKNGKMGFFKNLTSTKSKFDLNIPEKSENDIKPFSINKFRNKSMQQINKGVKKYIKEHILDQVHKN